MSGAFGYSACDTTSEMHVAASDAAAKADENMNRAYNLSLAGVAREERRALEASQKAFLKYGNGRRITREPDSRVGA